MRIAYQVKVKNGALWEAAQSIGGVRALAEHLEIRYEYLVALMNMRAYPGFRGKNSKLDWRRIEERLFEITNLTLDEIFPEEIASSAFMDCPKVRTIVADSNLEQISSAHNRLLAPVSECERRIEIEDAVSKVLKTLSQKEEDIVKRYFGIGDYRKQTLKEIGVDYKNTASTAGLVVAKALRKLRHPSRSRLLKAFAS